MSAAKTKVGEAEDIGGVKRKWDGSEEEANKRLAVEGSGDISGSSMALQASHVETTGGQGDQHGKPELTLQVVLDTLRKELDGVGNSIDTRCSELKDSQSNLGDQIAQRIMDEVKRTVDEVVNKKLSEMKAEIDGDIQRLQKAIDDMQTRAADSKQSACSNDLTLNIVIHKLPEADGENTVNKVNRLLAEGMSLGDVNVETAERKKS